MVTVEKYACRGSSTEPPGSEILLGAGAHRHKIYGSSVAWAHLLTKTKADIISCRPVEFLLLFFLSRPTAIHSCDWWVSLHIFLMNFIIFASSRIFSFSFSRPPSIFHYLCIHISYLTSLRKLNRGIPPWSTLSKHFNPSPENDRFSVMRKSCYDRGQSAMINRQKLKS